MHVGVLIESSTLLTTSPIVILPHRPSLAPPFVAR
jgi:hypothetical protein